MILLIKAISNQVRTTVSFSTQGIVIGRNICKHFQEKYPTLHSIIDQYTAFELKSKQNLKPK